MKKNGLFRSLLIIVVIVLLVLILPKHKFILQYSDNGEIKTELFESRKEFNSRVGELKSLGVDSIWLSKE